MERDDFVTNNPEGWWLVRDDLDYQLAAPRDELGQALGRSDREWYKDLDLLLRFYQFLENNHYELLVQLDDAADDEARRLQWLQDAIAAAGPEEESAQAESEESAATEPQGAAAEDPGQWDETWQMLYRVGADGTYEFAESDDHVAIRPGSSWMSQEEATALRQAPATTAEAPPAATAEAPPAAGAAVSEEAATAAQEVLDDMKSAVGEVAEELGLSQEEMAALADDPEFQQLLAEELEQELTE